MRLFSAEASAVKQQLTRSIVLISYCLGLVLHDMNHLAHFMLPKTLAIDQVSAFRISAQVWYNQ